MGYISRVTLACLSQPIRSSQTAYCYTCGLLYAGAAQGELPEGQEKVPWGMTVPRNSFVWILCVAPTNCTRYAVGCDKVNCPKGKRRCPGVRLGAPYQTICRRPIVGAASGRPHNTTPSHSLHSTSLFYAKKNPKPRFRVLSVSAFTS